MLARKYDGAEVDAAIAKLKQYNYLNDAESCRRQFEIFYEEGKLGVQQIIDKLIRRGFEKEFIEQLIPDDAGEHDLAAASRALEKKFPGDTFERNKAWQFLATRGFDAENISLAIAKFPKKAIC